MTSQEAFNPSDAPRAVTPGYATHCGVKTDSEVACWGNWSQYPEMLSVPSGSFTQVVTGHHHNCALSTTGELTCWGDNDQGQLNVPN
ncbi:hypothetical protein ACN469_39110 [Corallococcus terminator]